MIASRPWRRLADEAVPRDERVAGVEEHGADDRRAGARRRWRWRPSPRSRACRRHRARPARAPARLARPAGSGARSPRWPAATITSPMPKPARRPRRRRACRRCTRCARAGTTPRPGTNRSCGSIRNTSPSEAQHERDDEPACAPRRRRGRGRGRPPMRSTRVSGLQRYSSGLRLAVRPRPSRRPRRPARGRAGGARRRSSVTPRPPPARRPSAAPASTRPRQRMTLAGMFMPSTPTTRPPRPKKATNFRSSTLPATTATSSSAAARPASWILRSYWSDQNHGTGA